MAYLTLYTLAYLYAFWCAYVLVMGIYRAHLSKRLTGLNRALAYPVVIAGALMDVAANWIIAPIIFLDRPREAFVTQRLVRYKAEDQGWRGALAELICDRMLDIFDPSENHC